MIDKSKLKAASQSISLFLSPFPKDEHTKLVLDYLFKKILWGDGNESIYLPSTSGQEGDSIDGDNGIELRVLPED